MHDDEHNGNSTQDLESLNVLMGIREADVRLAKLWCSQNRRIAFHLVRPIVPATAGFALFGGVAMLDRPRPEILVCALVLSFCTGLARGWFARAYADRLISSRGCLNCGYPLLDAARRRTSSGICPECGASFSGIWYSDEARRRLLE